MKKSTPIVAPKKTITTPPVHTPVLGDNRVTNVWMPGLLRKLDEPKQINIHRKEGDSSDDSFTDEDEECEEFASDVDDGVDDDDVYEGAADTFNAKLSSPASNTQSKNQVTMKEVTAQKIDKNPTKIVKTYGQHGRPPRIQK
jgi:hypothetical protein